MDETMAEILAREAEEAEARAEAEERAEVAPKPGQRARRQAADATQVYSVRIPVDHLEDLRQLAGQLDIPPSVLLRRWVIERLGQELRGEPAAKSLGLNKAEIVDAISEASKAAIVEALQDAARTRTATEMLRPGRKPVEEASRERYLDPSGPVRLGATRRLATELSPLDMADSHEEIADVRSEHV
jgi:hypothetical protein